ncbi:MAG: MBL fold metallo-hydrolase [archaeon]|jgi:glyoxylase-like metal-dependent hydrolase (beta-lactamase superfamily II)
MAEVIVLVEGYARSKGDYYEASGSTVLIKDNGKKILVDPGCNEKLLLNALKKQKLSLKDIDCIFLSHYHVDHILNLRLFPKKDVLDGDIIYRGDKEYSFSKTIPGTTIEVIPTPGHAHEEVTLLVKTKKGVVAVAEDLWWWEEGRQKTDLKSLLELKDSFVKNEEQLKKSRELILSKADWIIPGHGKMFKVPKK